MLVHRDDDVRVPLPERETLGVRVGHLVPHDLGLAGLGDRDVGDPLEPGHARGTPEQPAEHDERGPYRLLRRAVLSAPVDLGPPDLFERAPVDPDAGQGPVETDRAGLDRGREVLHGGGELPFGRDRGPAFAARGQGNGSRSARASAARIRPVRPARSGAGRALRGSP